MDSYHVHYKASSTEMLDVCNFERHLSFKSNAKMAVITQGNFDLQ